MQQDVLGWLVPASATPMLRALGGISSTCLVMDVNSLKHWPWPSRGLQCLFILSPTKGINNLHSRQAEGFLPIHPAWQVLHLDYASALLSLSCSWAE